MEGFPIKKEFLHINRIIWSLPMNLVILPTCMLKWNKSYLLIFFNPTLPPKIPWECTGFFTHPFDSHNDPERYVRLRKKMGSSVLASG